MNPQTPQPLTPDQIKSYLGKMQTGSGATANPSHSWDAFASAVNPPKSVDSSSGDNTILPGIMSDVAQRGKDIVARGQQTAEDIKNAGGGFVPRVAGAFQSAADITGNAAGAVGNAALLTGKAFVNKLNGDNGEQLNKAGDAFMNATNIFGEKNSDTIAKVGSFIKDGLDNLPPNVVNSFKNFLDTAGLLGGAKASTAPVEDVVSETIQGAKNTMGTVKQGVSDVVSATKNKIVNGVDTSIKDTINAVNPDLSGKKLVNAYKQTVTGGRDVTPSSIFKEQALSPDEQAVKLGTRLSDLKLGKNPVKNLETLKNALTDTENKLNTALKGNPDIVYNLDKQTLVEKLGALSKDKPGDFIGDNGKIYDNVVKFGQKTIAKAEDTISGGRDARTAFDAEAKRRFPSAFKDGKIDVSTPAGSAIKTVRDAINEHIYDVAPNGSEIKGLIGREADIFRATDNIAQKAAMGHGESAVGKFMTKNPKTAKVIKYGAAGAAGAAGIPIIKKAF